MASVDCYPTQQQFPMSNFTDFQTLQGGIIQFTNPANGTRFYIYEKEIQF